jgi:FRG domain-containing protein
MSSRRLPTGKRDSRTFVCMLCRCTATMIGEDAVNAWTRQGVDIADLETLHRAVQESSSAFDFAYPFWRGHADISWPLKAEVFRPPITGRKSYPEITLIRTFMGQAESRSQRCPPRDDLIGWLILARHFGLPTRILDWSMSPLVALFFAVENSDLHADGALWALSPGQLNSAMMGEFRLLVPDEPQVQEIVKLAYEVNPVAHAATVSTLGGRVLAVSTREIYPRVMVQQGAFTIHADGKDMGEMAPEQKPWLIAFRIPHAAKDHLRETLRSFGISRSTLFPDLGSLADDIKRRRFKT